MALPELKINDQLSWRDVNGELVALDVVSGEYHVFNDLGRKIWLAVAEDKHADMDALVGEIVSEYDTQESVATADVKQFIADLVERGLLMEVSKQKKGEEDGKGE